MAEETAMTLRKWKAEHGVWTHRSIPDEWPWLIVADRAAREWLHFDGEATPLDFYSRYGRLIDEGGYSVTAKGELSGCRELAAKLNLPLP